MSGREMVAESGLRQLVRRMSDDESSTPLEWPSETLEQHRILMMYVW